jgi:glucokinase
MKALLSGDVGGTKTKLGLFALDGPLGGPYAESTFTSRAYPSLDAILGEFLAKRPNDPLVLACFAVAGPVAHGRAKMTNLDWTLDAGSLSSLIGAPVDLINDLEALATEVPYMADRELVTIRTGVPDPSGPAAVIAPGTGLGEAFITRCGQTPVVHPSEGGHADFAPTDDAQVELLHDMMGKMSHVSYEEVCSGLGIENIHSHLARTNPDSPKEHADKVRVASDPVPLIAGAALDGSARCGTCSATFEMFTSILGAEAGNLALKVLATGGVYLGGGIPRKTLPLLQSGAFIHSFDKKGRFSGFMSSIPVRVVMDPGAPLLGAARHAMQIREREIQEKVAGP